ncbi:MAG: hypothetical protein JWO90_2115 [Solirubrobacterales bacterium]|jgi:hypothetical protein|nr:hypothetical protein [Solirubrobacterales bacterium]
MDTGDRIPPHDDEPPPLADAALPGEVCASRVVSAAQVVCSSQVACPPRREQPRPRA